MDRLDRIHLLGPHSEDESALLSGVDEDSWIIPRAAEELFRYIYPVVRTQGSRSVLCKDVSQAE